MTIATLLSNPEFWSALFGALAAFLLGVLATWWTNVNAKRTAGNLTLISLSQMYGLMENLRHHMLVLETTRSREILGRDPYCFELRPAIGLPDRPPAVPIQDLGFLADTHDPDVLSRLLTVERGFASMLDLVRRHETLHARFQQAINDVDPSGQRAFTPQDVLEVAGAKLMIEIDTTIEELRTGLPETRDQLLAVGGQLRDILRAQFPGRRFIRFIPAPRSRLVDQPPPGVAKPALWRRQVLWTLDAITKPRFVKTPKMPDSTDEPTPPHIRRFPPRSWENRTPPPGG
jgi:hypothetical protein